MNTIAAAAQATTAATTAQKSLTGNYQTFLKLLMTQLQNQDPTSPLDTNQFTSQLVQYSSVEQQINMNSNLNQLIELSQTNGVLQSASLVGQNVAVDSDRLALQAGRAAVRFTAASAGPVEVAVYSAKGERIAGNVVNATAGENSWTWDGGTISGATAADGAYRVIAKTQPLGGGAGAELPFVVLAKATGVEQQGKALQLQLGALSVKMSAVRSVAP
jgi:flagellar basal-body rod modification protein FlgD